MISAFLRHSISGVKSPLSYTTDFLIFAKRGCQSLSLYFTRAFRGAIYTVFLSGCSLIKLRIANSLIIVFPEPVGAPTNIFLSV
jgi:hypothetical protein